MGVTPYGAGDPREHTSELKAVYSQFIGDVCALGALKPAGREVTFLVGADDDFDAFEEATGFGGLVGRFRDLAA
jgi:hypothetical protein